MGSSGSILNRSPASVKGSDSLNALSRAKMTSRLMNDGGPTQNLHAE
jgi:hypothetical protein